MYPAVTLDGFIADLNGALVGRKTYEQYADDYPAKNGSITFVYTTSTDQQDQEKVKFVRGTPEEVLRQAESFGFTEIIISGGGEVNGSFAEAGLVDEIIVSCYGVTLGEGIPLFGSHKPKLRLELLSSTQDVPGIVKNHYKVL